MNTGSKEHVAPLNFLMLTLAGVVNAFGVTAFLTPVRLYDSGISGTSMLISQVTPDYISLSLLLAALNIPLFLYGLREQGKVFTIYAIYAVAVYAFVAYILMNDVFFDFDENLASPLAGSDLLLCALFGGIISGAGSGIALRFGGAMDGMEVLAVIFSKKLGVSVGTFVMIYNVLLYIVCGFVIHSWILPLYSIVTYMAALKTIDFLVEGIDRSKSVMVVTTKPKEVGAILSETFAQGLTMIPSKGFYSNQDSTVIYLVLNRFQIAKMRELVHVADPTAFITISEVADIYKQPA